MDGCRGREQWEGSLLCYTYIRPHHSIASPTIPVTQPPAPIGEIKPIAWQDDCLILLDQTKLPAVVEWACVRDVPEAIAAIRAMQVRGAPAIGVTAAYAMALAARSINAPTMSSFLDLLDPLAAKIAAARPTAVNLGWAVQRCLDMARTCRAPSEARERLLKLAHAMRDQDIESNRAIGRYGAGLMPRSGGVLTHCNTGALATAGYGTALGVIRAAWEQGRRFSVFCTETRPWLQGARLTTWELAHLGIPATLIVDSAAAVMMASGEIDAVVVGADRIAANGDVANKVGTYMLAVLAKEHDIPFYVAAPRASIDLGTGRGEDIRVEDRPPEEVTSFAGRRVSAEGIGARNPAFDITPARLIAAVVTDLGVVRPPYETGLRAVANRPSAEGAA